jgi:uncharacterized glyoxalase superfamily protein PhnB
MSDWSDIKVGDPVIVRIGYGHASYMNRVVEKRTSAQFTVSGFTFRVKDGKRLGSTDRFSSVSVHQPTPELLATVEEEELRGWFNRAAQNGHNLTVDQIRAIKAIVEPAK